MEQNIAVVGGSSLDICAKSTNDAILHDSNSGKVQFGVGGAARNIAELMAILGFNSSLLTAVSDNGFGNVILSNAAQQGIMMLNPAIKDTEYQTGVYVYMADYDGKYVMGINELDITNLITVDYVKKNINALYFANDVVLDANLPEETIAYLTEQNFKLFAESVSVEKCIRLVPFLDKFYLLRANYAEAKKMTGKTEPDEIVRDFVKKGLSRGIITMGAKGSLYFEKSESGISVFEVPAVNDDNFVDANGCGEAFLCGFMYGLMREHSIEDSMFYGLSLAVINGRSMASVNRESISYEALAEMKEHLIKKNISVSKRVL